MADLNLSTLTEADIITKRVLPAILDAAAGVTQRKSDRRSNSGTVRSSCAAKSRREER